MKKLFALFCLLSPLSLVQANEAPWYAGITIGANDSKDDHFGGPKEKYGIKGGYQLKSWLSVESELVLHSNESNRFCDNSQYSNECITLKQKYNYGFIGLRAMQPVGDVFAFTARLGGSLVNYDSNLEGSESKFNVSSSLGVAWNIKNTLLTLEAQQVDYPLANKQNDNFLSANLSLVIRF